MVHKRFQFRRAIQVTRPLDTVIRQLEAIPEAERRDRFITIAWQSVNVIYNELHQEFEAIVTDNCYWSPKLADEHACAAFQRALALGHELENSLTLMKEEAQENMQRNLTQ